MVFIAGGNGGGKTTLAKLLTGLYLPQSGELRFNGAPIDDARCQHFRSHFAAVFSDFYLSATLPYEPTQESDALARQYLTMLRLDGKVTINNGVLSTTDLPTVNESASRCSRTRARQTSVCFRRVGC